MKTIFTAASFNIQHGVLSGFDWKRLTVPVLRINADILGVQEVDMGTNRSRGNDTIKCICQALLWQEGRFVPSMQYDGGQYGNGMFSKEPFEYFESLQLPHLEHMEPRSCGHTTVRLENGIRLHFFNTHLSYETAESRREQFIFLKKQIEKISPDDTFLITGDFNTQDEAEFSTLPAWRTALTNVLDEKKSDNNRHFKTFPDTHSAIDNIVFDSSHLTLQNAGMETGTLSDHNLLWAKFLCHS